MVNTRLDESLPSCHFAVGSSLCMICNLCKQPSDRMIRVASWQVCQWCVSHNVLDHALAVESDIAKLREAVAKTSATHEDDVRNETVSKSRLELAYAAFEELTTAMNDLSKSTAASNGSLKIELDAKKALHDYKRDEEKTRRAHRRHGYCSPAPDVKIDKDGARWDTKCGILHIQRL